LAMYMEAPNYGQARRRLQVLKFRGSDFESGYHDFSIRTGGMVVYPRLVASEHAARFERALIASGVESLDRLMGGGVERGTSTLMVGPPGCGKSTLALQYAVAAARRGDHAASYIFDETRAALHARATGISLQFKEGRGPG